MDKITITKLDNANAAWRGLIRNLAQAEKALGEGLSLTIDNFPVDTEIAANADIRWLIAGAITKRARYFYMLASQRIEIPRHYMERLHVMENSIEDRILHNAP